MADYNVHYVLELACAAQRVNGEYQKESAYAVREDGNLDFDRFRSANKVLMTREVSTGQGQDQEPRLVIGEDDTLLAVKIKKHFRRLAFDIMATPDNEFLIEVNTILYSDRIEARKFGFIACLPSVYFREVDRLTIKRRANDLSAGFVGAIGAKLKDKDCEILESKHSKNFNAWSICAIMDNKMISWFSKTNMQIGPCVLIKGTVKDYSELWQHNTPLTRLNYVKAAQ